QNFYMDSSILPADPARKLRALTFAYEASKPGTVEQTFHAAVFAVSARPAPAPHAETFKPKPLDDVDEAWVKSVQALPGKEQIKRVIEKLVELNPGFDGQFTWKEELNLV